MIALHFVGNISIGYTVTPTQCPQQQQVVVFRLGADKLEGASLDEADADGDDHDDVDEGVGDVEDEDGDEVVAGLADQGEVEDEGDGEGDQAEQAQEHPRLGVGHVQPMVHWGHKL